MFFSTRLYERKKIYKYSTGKCIYYLWFGLFFFAIRAGFSGIKIDFFKLFRALAFKFWNVTCRGHFWSISKAPIYISDAIRERGARRQRDYHLNRAFGLRNNVFFTRFKSYFMREKKKKNTPAQKLHFPVSCLFNSLLN